MKKKLIVAFVCVGITGVIGFRLVTNKKKIDEKKRSMQVENIRIPVTTVTAREEIIQGGMVKAGTLAPFKEAKVLSVSNGIVQRLLFNPGDNVRQEQILAIIDTR